MVLDLVSPTGRLRTPANSADDAGQPDFAGKSTPQSSSIVLHGGRRRDVVGKPLFHTGDILVSCTYYLTLGDRRGTAPMY
jgi:hypothetical protein